MQQNAEVPTGTVEVTMKDYSKVVFYITDVNEFQALYEKLVDDDSEIIFQVSDVVRPSLLEKMMPYIVGLIAFVVVVMLMVGMQGAGGGGGAMANFGKSRAKMTSDADNKTTFDDVAGLREEKEDLEEVVDFLKSPSKYAE